ncbi:MvaI/BcnI family restriction endonuclease [Serratia rubidaea]|uniref:MvaI/BcnI family restriction endonuclease n=1 Tax=Serratia rubidaea TaxID=61652 RepID=UPI00234B2C92|nr:MvaI/BcnI family restriction endonuclease [Serratia rubidaea]MDC6120856.1 MvaI/BcnI family restriction endonuclease [Serratia rubidaea]
MSNFDVISQKMREHGAKRIIFKSLANNDNTKQQIYLGKDFDVIKHIPSGEIYSAGISKKEGPIFKSSLNLFWIDTLGNTENAPNAQIILYPKYPEIRMSGFLSGTDKRKEITPRSLMQAPTPEQRHVRKNINRYMILGVNNEKILAYCTSWNDNIAEELINKIKNNEAVPVASVFYEIPNSKQTSEEKLLKKLKEIYNTGEINSCKLSATGDYRPYKAKNGAGYTLEAQFGITPNSSPDPDFMDWELKAHSGSVVTLMTPEPNTGIYIYEGLKKFLDEYATKKESKRLDFASIHKVGSMNLKTSLTMVMEGYDPVTGKITDPEGGLMLRDTKGNLAAGWFFSKIIEHWKKKHSNTCYVSYSSVIKNSETKYIFGPEVTLGRDTNLTHFLSGLYDSTIYYDPGINMKLEANEKTGEENWRPKKRNQFRAKWKNINKLYSNLRNIDLRKI